MPSQGADDGQGGGSVHAVPPPACVLIRTPMTLRPMPGGCQEIRTTVNTERRIVMHPTRKRTLAKTVSWRAVATLDTFIISYLVTGSGTWAGAIAGFEVLTKVVIYYCHERVWMRIYWGR